MNIASQTSFQPEDIFRFIQSCHLDNNLYAYASSPGGNETLYASTFVVMLFHYLGRLKKLTKQQREDWAEYINRWQDIESGLFIGPELVNNEMSSRKHSFRHIAMHLTAHALPALALLGSGPKRELRFAHQYTSTDTLQNWLAARDWRDAWLEGNNLLFIAQFLIHLRDVEHHSGAQTALTHYFDWLDSQVDPATGLWGTNGYCSNAAALYGGYHQLLAYYYENRPVNYRERLIDIALELQHPDGGFHLGGGGGACEDVDAIDILVNLYKQVKYRRVDIRLALRRALPHILEMQQPDGGFIYRRDQSFIHMGIQKTASPANHSNLFPTWFRVHTLALMAEILTDEPALQFEWQFNNTCSMGWHQPWEKRAHELSIISRLQERSARSTRWLAAQTSRFFSKFNYGILKVKRASARIRGER